jgi:hypothetical protein
MVIVQRVAAGMFTLLVSISTMVATYFIGTVLMLQFAPLVALVTLSTLLTTRTVFHHTFIHYSPSEYVHIADYSYYRKLDV